MVLPQEDIIREIEIAYHLLSFLPQKVIMEEKQLDLDIDALLQETFSWKDTLKEYIPLFASCALTVVVGIVFFEDIQFALEQNRRLLRESAIQQTHIQRLNVGEAHRLDLAKIADTRFRNGCIPVISSAANGLAAALQQGIPIWDSSTNGFLQEGVAVCDPFGGTGVIEVRELHQEYIAPSGFTYDKGDRIPVVSNFAQTHDRESVKKVFTEEVLNTAFLNAQQGRVSNLRVDID